jgi:hypothetical protein
MFPVQEMLTSGGGFHGCGDDRRCCIRVPWLATLRLKGHQGSDVARSRDLTMTTTCPPPVSAGLRLRDLGRILKILSETDRIMATVTMTLVAP